MFQELSGIFLPTPNSALKVHVMVILSSWFGFFWVFFLAEGGRFFWFGFLGCLFVLFRNF